MEEVFTREEIIKAIQKYQELKAQNKLNKNREAMKFALKYEESFYPTLYILDLACHIQKNSKNFDTYCTDYGTRKSREILKKLKFEIINTEENNMIEKNNIFIEKTKPLNQILYGPPGTGKTYNTINKALKIIDGEVSPSREDAREKFNKYREEGQIEFVTFHQSYGYEEFVEGIKADIKSSEIKYKLEKGIFQELSKKAEENYFDSKKSESQLQKELTLNEKIETFLNEAIENEIVFRKIHKQKIFKIVEIMEDTIIIEADGVQNQVFLQKKELKEVLELEQNFDSVGQLSKDGLGYKSHRQIDSYYFSLNKTFREFKFKNIDVIKEINVPLKNYILIIDEINRGNISKIFGELITLIEPSKRIGADEELKLTLPNSKDSFGVPSNLYIIGTMNTADRSIAQIDTALRRRFEFEEMMPKPELLNDVVIEDIKISEILKAINERIEYIYDREHTIGHSYFLPLIKEPTKEKLDEIFKVYILPLLTEYFYGDWEDIRFVLNNDFVIEKKPSSYINSSTRQLNKVYEINETFKASEYLKIYATDNN